MFDKLFSRPGVVRRYRDGPLAPERATYLEGLAAQGTPRGTILRHASYGLCVATELQRWPSDHCFDHEEVEALACAWATDRTAGGWASSPRWPKQQFRSVATNFLGALGRLRLAPAPEPGPYHQELAEFLARQQESRWPSATTCQSAKWQITRFLDHLEQRQLALGDITPSDVDGYFEHMAQRWSRVSLHTSAKMLRAWFKHCEAQGWVQSGLAEAILLPRIYRQEGLPLGPSWQAVGQMLNQTMGEDPTSLRDHAVILMLSVYGLRSAELRRLRLEDIDWLQDRVRLVRAKSGREERLPIEPSVGNAIARYLRDGRPKSNSRAVFLTLHAPYRSLSAGGLYGLVERRLSKVTSRERGRGPHGLRHACARHLMESGRSFKEIGDHLGHRSPEATRIYAKVDLRSLRRVALDDLGGLV